MSQEIKQNSFSFRENPERTFDLVLKVKCHASENEGMCVLFILKITVYQNKCSCCRLLEHDTIRIIIVLNVYLASSVLRCC